jgi:hypothetical protein
MKRIKVLVTLTEFARRADSFNVTKIPAIDSLLENKIQYARLTTFCFERLLHRT